MKLRPKLILGFVIVSLIAGLVGMLGLYANDRIVSSYEIGEEHFGSILEASNEVSSYAKRAEGHTMLFLTLHNESDRKKALQRIASLHEQIAILEARIKDPDAKNVLNNTKSKTDELQLLIESFFNIHDDEFGKTGTIDLNNHEESIRKLDDISSNIRQNGLDLGKIEVNLQIEHNLEANKDASFLYALIVIISCFAVLGSLAIGLILERSISGPLQKLKDAFIQIKDGNYDLTIKTRSDDEIADLSNEFNKMAQDLKRSNEELRSSLAHKEVLLREIHHRVKNNMQIISSLLDHQMDSVKDKQLTEAFLESQNRITSMALIHEKLYRSADLMKIDFKEYVDDLAVGLFQSYGVNTGNIQLNTNVENISLEIDIAIPIGLVINELITNSIKYAFPEGRKGMIYITARSINDRQVEIVIGDNGIGIPENLDFRNTGTLGLHLVTTLIENQLHGKIDLQKNKGTEFVIQFRG